MAVKQPLQPPQYNDADSGPVKDCHPQQATEQPHEHEGHGDCGMALERNPAWKAPKAAVLYTCPMHPEIE